MVLVGAQNWAPNATGFVYLKNTYSAVTGSALAGNTTGNPLFIQTIVPLFEGGPGQAQVSCVPVVDGTWAGQFGMAPSLPSTDTSKEGWVWMGTATPYLVWSSARIYTGISAGPHQFSVHCWANQNNVVLPGPTATSIASLIVFEIQ